ncbi:MarR family transcriptional regulator [Rhizobium leguminosarum]|uniref:MarR family transcriptional regulator n=1 Tax=Rhizobium leguminosarum TaxID=384 RepID=UPI001C9846AC|nr:MarR family transcriptional regulator [Rhizobium leguminosarum]MBY5569585.1 MarR family transcriptional regulator [Rhizobium leguminosarum]MBY5574881.1 MarR family transcriptional regulator [Rhizobium leguminosarum]
MSEIRLYAGVRDFAADSLWVEATGLMRHPSYASALLAYCEFMTARAPKLLPANKLFAQKQRYFVSFLLICLYVQWLESRGAPPSLALLQRSAPGSPRQIADFINGLRDRGLIIATSLKTDRRTQILKPSLELLREIAQSPLAALRSSELLAPPLPIRPDDLVMDEDRLARWLALSAERYAVKDDLFGPFPAVVRHSERDAGHLVFCSVIAEALHQRTGSPASGSLTYRGLAERFDVSRQHISNIFDEAAQNGWYRISPGGEVALMPEHTLLQFETWVAGQMVHYRHLALTICER